VRIDFENMRNAIMRNAFSAGLPDESEFRRGPVVLGEARILKLLLDQNRERMAFSCKFPLALQLQCELTGQLPALRRIGSDDNGPVWLHRVSPEQPPQGGIRTLVLMDRPCC